jgi:hypothetical protein
MEDWWRWGQKQHAAPPVRCRRRAAGAINVDRKH